MSRVIDAIYENGVFRPAKKIRLKDKQQVRLQIVSEDDWRSGFDKALKSIRGKAARFSRKEVEADLEDALREVRRERRARESRS